MNPIFSAAIGSLLRYGLMILATFLVKQGIWTSSAAEGYVEAAVLALLALGWSYRKIIFERAKFLTGLMPGPKTEAEVLNHIYSGAPTPALNTPANTVPGVPLPTLLDGKTPFIKEIKP